MYLYISTYFTDKSPSPGIKEQRNSYYQYIHILVLLILSVLRQIAKEFLTLQQVTESIFWPPMLQAYNYNSQRASYLVPSAQNAPQYKVPLCSKQSQKVTLLSLTSKHRETVVTVRLHNVFVTDIVRGCCQHRNELSCSIKREIFFNYVSDSYYYHVEQDSAL